MTTHNISLMDDASLIAKAKKLTGPFGLNKLPGKNREVFGQVREELQARGYTVGFYGREYQTLSIESN
jgi:hypothetical protein